MFKKLIKNNKGITLLELMVSVTIFSIIVLSSTQIFEMVTESQRNAVAAQNIQESMRYAMEVASKEIRMAQKVDSDCDGAFGIGAVAINKVYNIDSGDTLFFKNKDGQCVAYFLNNSRLTIFRSGTPDVQGYITPDEIIVSNLSFNVEDDLIGAFHSVQPMVTINMDVEAVGKEKHKQKITIQTSIASRYYE